MPSVSGGTFDIFDRPSAGPIALQIVPAPADNPPPPDPGKFNVELIEGANGSGFNTPPGYQAVVTVSSDGHTINLLHGNIGTIDTSSGGYRFFAGDGSDTLIGANNDTLTGSKNSNAHTLLDASKGSNEKVYVVNGPTTVIGGDHTTIQGGTGKEFINGSGGNHEQIHAGSGDVTIIGGVGDTITGGAGNDFIDGSAGHELIVGGKGLSTTILGGDADTIRGASGNQVVAGNGNMSIDGSSGGQIINLGSGDATVAGTGIAETVPAGTAGDLIKGGSGNATITGGQNDTIYAGSGFTSVDGSAGHELITAGSGTGANTNTIIGGANDTIQTGTGDAQITLGSGPEFVQDPHGPTTTQTASDTVYNFDQNAGDRLSFAGENTTTIDHVIANQTTSGGNTILHLPDGTTITLVGVTGVDSSFFGPYQHVH